MNSLWQVKNEFECSAKYFLWFNKQTLIYLGVYVMILHVFDETSVDIRILLYMYARRVAIKKKKGIFL